MSSSEQRTPARTGAGSGHGGLGLTKQDLQEMAKFLPFQPDWGRLVERTNVKRKSIVSEDESKAIWEDIFQMLGATDDDMKTDITAKLIQHCTINGTSERGSLIDPQNQPYFSIGDDQIPGTLFQEVIKKHGASLRRFMAPMAKMQRAFLKNNPDDAAANARAANVPSNYGYAAFDTFGHINNLTAPETHIAQSIARVNFSKAGGAIPTPARVRQTSDVFQTPAPQGNVFDDFI